MPMPMPVPNNTDALDTAWVNVRKMEISNVDLVLMDVQTIKLNSGKSYLTYI
jgi:hypothetical protein